MRHTRVKPLPEVIGELSCQDPSAAAPPQVTPAMVLRAFRSIGLPEPVAHTQPEHETLINFDTIFYTDAAPMDRTVNLLGQEVALHITPSRFTWVHGDGTVATTSGAGAPYPSKEITYRYQDAHVTVSEHVQVTWSATYSVNGGPTRPVPGTVTTTGPDSTLRIAEAVPALSGAGH